MSHASKSSRQQIWQTYGDQIPFQNVPFFQKPCGQAPNSEGRWGKSRGFGNNQKKNYSCYKTKKIRRNTKRRPDKEAHWFNCRAGFLRQQYFWRILTRPIELRPKEETYKQLSAAKKHRSCESTRNSPARCQSQHSHSGSGRTLPAWGSDLSGTSAWIKKHSATSPISIQHSEERAEPERD